MLQIVIVEDGLTSRFAPLSLLRPVFELRCGHFSVRERLQHLSPTAQFSAVLRSELADVYREEQPAVAVCTEQTLLEADTLLINGRWLCDRAAFHVVTQLPAGTAAMIGDDWAALRVGQTPVRANLASITQALQQASRTSAAGHLLKYPWELIEQNPLQLPADFNLRQRRCGQTVTDPRIAILGDIDRVYIDDTAAIDPFVVIDARQGPVWIDSGAKIQAFTRLEGPCFIGRETQLFRANVREGCSIGPVCRIGGEIEASIIHGYANKYHDGFLGHAYICPWVNLGAHTINSDLKNDYSTVKIMVEGAMLDSGSTKVGCFIGDHTKTALASLFNTGSSVGVMSLVLPGGELLPKVIPSFARIWHGRLEELPAGIEAGMAAARIAMSRRQQILSPAAEALLRQTFQQTATARAAAIARTH